MKFTPARINAAKSPVQGEQIEWDDTQPGFGLRLRDGRKSFIVQYRLLGKSRKDRIAPVLGLVTAAEIDSARETARQFLKDATSDRDPRLRKHERRERAAQTLGAVAELYLEYKRKQGMRERSLEEVTRHLTGAVHWGKLANLPIDGFSRAIVAKRLDEIAENSGPVAANRSRASLSALFGWAMRRGLVEHNPVTPTEKPGEERGRDRILSDEELAAIWKECRDDDYGRIVRLLMLTGQRREEVGGILEDELDLPGRLWTLPGERTKNHQAHEVPLSDEAIRILQDAPRREGRRLLFGNRDGPFSGWSGAKEALDERVAKASKAASPKPPASWRLHDIRRTVATRMAELGIQPHIVEAILNHISGHKSGVAGIYNRATYRDEKRKALDRWAEHVLVTGKQSNVVALRGR